MSTIITERLTIAPMSCDELMKLIELYADISELSGAYREMLDSCQSQPEQQLWYTAWKICLRDDGSEIGYAGFKGFNGGQPEIGYGINDGYTGRAYASEAVKALCEWALSMPGVIAVQAEAEAANARSISVLRKTGFAETGQLGAEGPRYILRKF